MTALVLLVLLAVTAVPMKVIWISLGVIGILLAGMFLGVYLFIVFLSSETGKRTVEVLTE